MSFADMFIGLDYNTIDRDNPIHSCNFTSEIWYSSRRDRPFYERKTPLRAYSGRFWGLDWAMIKGLQARCSQPHHTSILGG